jgi:hypothetical protein
VHTRSISTVQTTECISDATTYITLGGGLSGFVVPDIHSAAEDKINVVKDSFYEEFEFVFDKCLKFHVRFY